MEPLRLPKPSFYDKIKAAFERDLTHEEILEKINALVDMYPAVDNEGLIKDYSFLEDPPLGHSGTDICKKHIWLIKNLATIIAKFRRCNGRIEVEISDIAGTTKWAEFEEDMVVTPAKHNGGSRRNKRSRRTRRAKSTRATKRNR